MLLSVLVSWEEPDWGNLYYFPVCLKRSLSKSFWAMGGHDYDDSISAVCERCDSNSGDRDTGARALATMLCNVCLCTVVINFVECALGYKQALNCVKICKFCTPRNCTCTCVRLYNLAVLHSIQSWTVMHSLKSYNVHALLYNHRPLSAPFLFRTSTSTTVQLARRAA